LENYGDYTLYVIDDNSTQETRDKIQDIVEHGTIKFLEPRQQDHLNGKQKSRFSVKVAYDYIQELPDDELVYIVEDDYLHYENSISKMVEAWKYFRQLSGLDVGIFPQDFVELYPHPQNQFNQTYVRPCIVAPGPDRYYRTTWFTHESFMVQVSTIKKYKEEFDKLLVIGDDEHAWEGTSISNVWTRPDFIMMMPMKTLAIHVSKKEDISFYCNDFEELWNKNAY
jgi:glycosyltransferase involved in cell wall biosynthesis